MTSEAFSPGEHKTGQLDTSELISRLEAAETRLSDVEYEFEKFAKPLVVEQERARIPIEERVGQGGEEILDAWMDQQVEKADPNNEHPVAVVMAVGLKEIIGDDEEKQSALVAHWRNMQGARAIVESLRQSLREKLAEEVVSLRGKIDAEALITHAMLSDDRERKEVQELIAVLYAEEPSTVPEFERRFALFERAKDFLSGNSQNLTEIPVVFRPDAQPDPLERQYSIDLPSISRTLQNLGLKTDKLQGMSESKLEALQELHELVEVTASGEDDFAYAIHATIKERVADILSSD